MTYCFLGHRFFQHLGSVCIFFQLHFGMFSEQEANTQHWFKITQMTQPYPYPQTHTQRQAQRQRNITDCKQLPKWVDLIVLEQNNWGRKVTKFCKTILFKHKYGLPVLTLFNRTSQIIPTVLTKHNFSNHYHWSDITNYKYKRTLLFIINASNKYLPFGSLKFHQKKRQLDNLT